MARPEDAKLVRTMKEAKTGRDIVLSWGNQAEGRNMKGSLELFRLYTERKPEMLETYAQNPLTQIVDRGILDRRTRYLVLLAIALARESREGVIAQWANAKGAGWTEEEVMEVAFLAAYQAGKGSIAFSADALTASFQAAAAVKVTK